MTEPDRAPALTDTPAPSAAEVQRLLNAELSPAARVGHIILLLWSLAGASVTGALLLTEPELPPRAAIALAILTMIALSWTGFAAWVLTRRRVLFAGHRIVAARMAILFSSIFIAGALAVGRWGGTGRTWYAAAGAGCVMLAVAVAMLLRARRHFAHLSARRAALEHRLGVRKADAR